MASEIAVIEFIGPGEIDTVEIGLVGESGPQGMPGADGQDGADGEAGPNLVSSSTATNLSGYLTANGSVVGATTAGSFVGTLVARQSGGTPGTDEVQVYHDGDHGYVRSMSGNLSVACTNALRLVSDTKNVLFETTGQDVFFAIQTSNARGGASYQIGWSPDVAGTGNFDTGLARQGAAHVKITNGSSGTGNLTAGTVNAATINMGSTVGNKVTVYDDGTYSDGFGTVSDGTSSGIKFWCDHLGTSAVSFGYQNYAGAFTRTMLTGVNGTIVYGTCTATSFAGSGSALTGVAHLTSNTFSGNQTVNATVYANAIVCDATPDSVSIDPTQVVVEGTGGVSATVTAGNFAAAQEGASAALSPGYLNLTNGADTTILTGSGLTTPGFVSAAQYRVVGYSPGAALDSLLGVFTVFDESGSSIGVVPVYSVLA